jgi:hypothetical protein
MEVVLDIEREKLLRKKDGELKFCRDCKHLLIKKEWECKHPINVKHNLVTGELIPILCRNERENYIECNCGSRGRLWEDGTEVFKM